MNEKLFQKLKKAILKRLRTNLPHHMYYHSPEHTERVVKSAEFIGKREHLSVNDLMLIKIAALFHDLGFINTTENHEEESSRMARDELVNYGLNPADIEKVCRMIMVTKASKIIHNLSEAVIADADSEYLGTDEFENINGRLLKELQFRNPELTIQKWVQIQIAFIEHHTYFTEFARKHFEPKKQEQLRKLKNSNM